MQCCVVPYRMWLEGSRLHDVMYEVVAFPEDWLQGKIKVRGPRTELAAPVSKIHKILKIIINKENNFLLIFSITA